jgi:AraC-like DNA-binding protein
VQTIADALFISPSHLLHQFKKEMDITLHQYIVMQKAQTAEILLLQGANPLEVAKQLGYEYYSTFYNNFVKYRGHPPSKQLDISPHSQKNIIE